MRCPNCAAEVSPLRDACANCGASTERLFADSKKQPYSGGERSPEELKHNRKTVLIVACCLLVFLTVMGRIHPFGHHLSFSPGVVRIDTTGSRDRGPVTAGAQELFQAYRDDPDAAERRFGHREIVVSGQFLRTVPDGYGSIDMRFKTSDPEAPLGVDLDRVSVDEATKLEAGQNVTVSCRRVARTGDEHWLQDCVIQPPAPSPAPPPPPAPASPPAPKSPNQG